MTGDTWTRAEKKMKERDRCATAQSELRDEWRSWHLRLADSHAKIAADHRAKAAALTLGEPDA